jgi:hypothetical protein
MTDGRPAIGPRDPGGEFVRGISRRGRPSLNAVSAGRAKRRLGADWMREPERQNMRANAVVDLVWVRGGQKSPFTFKEANSTRTLSKPLILPNVGLLYRPPSAKPEWYVVTLSGCQ